MLGSGGLVLLFVFGQTDGGSEFEGCFAEFLQHDGSHHEVSAALSPWQKGVAERRGGMWKLAFQKLLLEHVPSSKADVEELCDHTKYVAGLLLPKSGCRFLHCDLGNRHVVAWNLSTFFFPMSGCRNLRVDLGELNMIHFALAIDSGSFIFRIRQCYFLPIFWV